MDRHTFKAARGAQKMSQGALAKAVGLTSSELSRIECGYRDIRPEEAKAIAAALGLVPASFSAPVAVAADATAFAAASASLAVVPVVAPTAIPQLLADGSNLDDPVNFTELPNLGVLESGALPLAVYHERLIAALTRATKILHTSRVRASVWREWRQFEKKIQALLQAR